MTQAAQGLLDTNVVIDLAHADPRGLPHEAAISVVTLAELAAGPLLANDDRVRAVRQAHLQQAEADFEPIIFDAACARAFPRVAADVRRAGRKGEAPDGATFHAWQNLRSEVMRRIALKRSRLMAIGISGILSVGMTACSYSGGDPATPEPSHSPVVTAPVTPTPAPSPTSQYDAYGIGATGPLKTDAYGQWRQAQLSEDAPAAQFDKDKYDEIVWESFTEEEAAEAQKLMAEFLATHYIDGVSAFDTSQEARQEQLDNTIGFISDRWVDSWEEWTLGDEPSASVNAVANSVVAQGYEPAAYSTDGLRFTTKNFDLKEGYRTTEGRLALHFTTEYEHAITKDGKEYTVLSETIYRSVVVKEGGEWKLSGWGVRGGFTVRDADGNIIE